MKFSYFLLIAACFATPISSSTLYMTYPEANSVYKIGDTMLIEWYTKLNELAAPLETGTYVTIALAYGQSNNLTIDRIMTTRSTLNLGFYQWIIPGTVNPRTDYVIEVGTDTSNIAFAGFITINQRNLAVTATATATSSDSIPHRALGLS